MKMACGNADQSHTASQKSKGQPEALLRLYLDYNPSKALKSRDKYEQRTICPNGEIRTRTIDANELVDLLLQMHFLKQSGEQLMLESNANDENGWAWNQIKVTRGKTVSYFTRIG